MSLPKNRDVCRVKRSGQRMPETAHQCVVSGILLNFMCTNKILFHRPIAVYPKVILVFFTVPVKMQNPRRIGFAACECWLRATYDPIIVFGMMGFFMVFLQAEW